MEEQETSKLLVAGSSPVSPTKRKDMLWVALARKKARRNKVLKNAHLMVFFTIFPQKSLLNV